MFAYSSIVHKHSGGICTLLEYLYDIVPLLSYTSEANVKLSFALHLVITVITLHVCITKYIMINKQMCSYI